MIKNIFISFLFLLFLLTGCLYYPRLGIPDYDMVNIYFENMGVDRTTDLYDDNILNLNFLELKKFIFV